MRFDRLLAAAQAVEESPAPDRFDMTVILHPCGTPSCVLGHYGLRTDLQDEFKPEPGDWQKLRLPGIMFSEPHFEITVDQFYELFSNDGCGGAQTPAQAGRYIRDFVARNGGPVT